jgi:hypothetical protein
MVKIDLSKKRMSKSDFAYLLCLTDQNERRAHTWKLQDYITEEALRQMHLSKDEYKNVRLFSAKQTQYLLSFLRDDIVN